LKTIFRQTDPIYIQILSEIRKGEISEENKKILQSYVHRDYNDKIPTKLYPVRSTADFINDTMFAKLNEKEIVFECIKKNNYTDKPIPIDKLNNCKRMTDAEIQYEFNALMNNTVPKLSLKKGAIVMCTFNIDLDNGICNGSQGVIIDIQDVPIVKFTNGIIKRMDIHYWQSEDYPSIAIGQIPLCLAWALTIHKIQGATLSMAEIDIGRDVFEYGQTYVALSRIQSLEGLYLSSFHPQKIKANPKVISFYNKLDQIRMNPFDTFKYKDFDPSIKKIYL